MPKQLLQSTDGIGLRRTQAAVTQRRQPSAKPGPESWCLRIGVRLAHPPGQCSGWWKLNTSRARGCGSSALVKWVSVAVVSYRNGNGGRHACSCWDAVSPSAYLAD